jgi:hypothetical protein
MWRPSPADRATSASFHGGLVPWRSVKYEEVYLHAYDSVAEARAGIGRYLAFYNEQRPHQPFLFGPRWNAAGVW